MTKRGHVAPNQVAPPNAPSGGSSVKPPAPPDGLRDQIAIRAMEIIVGGNASTFLEQVSIAPNESFQNVSRIAFGLADAMIEARNRK